MHYTLLIFDADDTLFDFKKSERVALEQTMQAFGFDYDEMVHLPIYHQINGALWKELDQGFMTQKALKVERFKRFKDTLNLDFDDNAFSSSYMKHLSHASFLFEDTCNVVQKLSLSCHLVMITNGLTDVQDRRIRQSVIAPYFKEITISEEVGVSKPDPAIFRHALRHFTNVETRHMLMIGDNLQSDILGGINSGIDTCWYNPACLKNDTDILPNYEIHYLKELLNLV